jgi:hypothetical protein
MKTLYESILDTTRNKVSDARSIASAVPPTSKDWKSEDRWECIYIDYRCPDLIKKYIDIIPNELFEKAKLNSNPHGVNKNDITTIRCIIGKHRPAHCRVELCTDNTQFACGVQVTGLYGYLNGVSVANAKKLVVEYFNRIVEDTDLLGRTFEHIKKEVNTLLKWGHCINEKSIWEIR